MAFSKLTLKLFLVAAVFASSIAQGGSPKKGGTLVFGRGGDSVTLDPSLATDGESLNVTDHIFDGLVTFTPEPLM